MALQLANIVRDLREDAERGRVYLTARDMVRYHLHDDGPLDAPALRALTREASMAEPAMVAGFEGGDVGQLYALMRFYCLRSRDWFHRGMELVALLDPRSAACVLAMAGIYWRLLGHRGAPRPRARTRARLKKREKAWVAARALLGKGIPERTPGRTDSGGRRFLSARRTIRPAHVAVIGGGWRGSPPRSTVPTPVCG